MDVSKIIEIKDLEVEVDNYDTKLNIVEFEGKFTSIDLPSLEVQYKCPKCNNTVSIQDKINRNQTRGIFFNWSFY